MHWTKEEPGMGCPAQIGREFVVFPTSPCKLLWITPFQAIVGYWAPIKTLWMWWSGSHSSKSCWSRWPVGQLVACSQPRTSVWVMVGSPSTSLNKPPLCAYINFRFLGISKSGHNSIRCLEIEISQTNDLIRYTKDLLLKCKKQKMIKITAITNTIEPKKLQILTRSSF